MFWIEHENFEKCFNYDTCCQIDVLEELVVDTFETKHSAILCETDIEQSDNTKRKEYTVQLAEQPMGSRH